MMQINNLLINLKEKFCQFIYQGHCLYQADKKPKFVDTKTKAASIIIILSEVLKKRKMNDQTIRGAEFLIKEANAAGIFIPEEWSEEQKMIAATAEEFIIQEIHPKLDELDSMKNPALMPGIVEKAGELGLLASSVPEEYGGFGLSFNTSMLLAEKSGMGFSFGTTFGAHTGIGTLPILYYGNEDQKKKYLPGLASGKLKTCYCLTEPEAGSDANSGKTKAVLSDDKKNYLITGQKMWITNGGFADIFIVFAKIDDDKNLSAFIVEKAFGGITIGQEEKKLGIKGSSTVQIIFNNCKVPVENLLSKREDGFKIALNILNIGRIKLAAAVVGGAKMGITKAVAYSKERKQFGKSISEFGAIQFKLAQMAILTYACETATYRAGQCIDDEFARLKKSGMAEAEAKLKSVEEYTIECALLKVFGSEMLDYVADEALQIHGGMGYSAELTLEKGYRDSRISRIYEGTNEINRLLSVGMLLRRILKGESQIKLKAEVGKVPFAVLSNMVLPDPTGFLAYEKQSIANLKQLFLLLTATAAQKLKKHLIDEQEIVMNLADILMEVYVAESVLLRVEKLHKVKGLPIEKIKTQCSIAKVLMYEAMQKISKSGLDAINSFSSGMQSNLLLFALRKLTKTKHINAKRLRREIAGQMIAEGKYCF
jgi:alkylation response protein AidB-like acyl-CoA dehydrogenase